MPRDLPGRADRLAAKACGNAAGGAGDAGRQFTAARILARGALAARVQGEDAVAGLFEDALRSYGRMAATARMMGRPEQLAPEPVPQAVRTGARGPHPASGAAGRPGRAGRNVSPSRRRAWRGSNLMRLFSGY